LGTPFLHEWRSRETGPVGSFSNTPGAAQHHAYFAQQQRFPSADQLRAAYPRFDSFCAKKARYDPSGLFSNEFYQAYRPGNCQTAAASQVTGCHAGENAGSLKFL
jgi:hypothetical protein